MTATEDFANSLHARHALLGVAVRMASSTAELVGAQQVEIDLAIAYPVWYFARHGQTPWGDGVLEEESITSLVGDGTASMIGPAIHGLLGLQSGFPPIQHLADLTVEYRRSALRLGRRQSNIHHDPWANAFAETNGLPEGVIDLSKRRQRDI